MNHETKRSRAAAHGTKKCPECKERFVPDYPGQIYCSSGRCNPFDWEPPEELAALCEAH
jgi:hypothetical protein